MYINALAFGGYQQADIYRDLRRKQLVKDGRDDLADVKVIDESKTADQQYNTPDYKLIITDADLKLPQYIGNIDSSLFENVIFQLPDEVYQVLSPPLDWNSPTGQAEIDKIKSAYHDVWLKQIEAKNEREKTIADETYKVLKNEIEKKYNIPLSDNSVEAWNQINKLGAGFEKGGLSGTGLYQEARDKYLQDIRKADERGRVQKKTEKEQSKREYYLNSASPKEINELSEQEKADYGIKPSQEFIDFFDKENLKKEYPGLSDREIDNYRNSIIDENGNYRSQLYQTLQANRLGIKEKKRTFQIGYVETDPDTGRVTGGEGLLYKKALEEEKKYRPFTGGGMFSKWGEKGAIGSESAESAVTGTGQPSDTGSTDQPTMITGYDQQGNPVQVEKGKYYPGISLTPPNTPDTPLPQKPTSTTPSSTTPSLNASLHPSSKISCN